MKKRAPGSVAGMMNQRQWLVDVSRAKEELRMFTDCPELVEQRVVCPEECPSAISLLSQAVTKVMGIDLQRRAAMRQAQRGLDVAQELER
jgi:hypothetical protein